LLGGIGEFVEACEKIVLKPNILFGEAPDKCVNTITLLSPPLGPFSKKPGQSSRMETRQ